MNEFIFIYIKKIFQKINLNNYNVINMKKIYSN